MSFGDRLRHTILIAHPDPTASPDGTGQLIVDATGQPVGDSTAISTLVLTDWEGATASRALVQERTAHWPDGPGAGSELVDTMIFLPVATTIRELDKVKRTDVSPEQVYQVTFVDRFSGYGPGDHIEARARRLPL